MKTKIFSLATGAALIAVLVIAPSALASINSDITKALAGSTTLELPAKAADLVAQAAPAVKQQTAARVIKTAINLNPSAAIAIVAAVASQNPATAPIDAVTAATIQHKRLDQITKAAVAAAPAQAANIVAALIKEFPRDYGLIAIAASEGSPSSGRAILAVVSDFVPGLQPSIQSATAAFNDSQANVPVRAILSESYNQALTTGAAVSTPLPAALVQPALPSATLASTTPGNGIKFAGAPPTQGQPYTPVPTTVTSFGPSQTQPEQPTGYSAPGP